MFIYFNNKYERISDNRKYLYKILPLSLPSDIPPPPVLYRSSFSLNHKRTNHLISQFKDWHRTSNTHLYKVLIFVCLSVYVYWSV